MDDQPDSAKEQSKINKIDLSALQGFSFGTQWTPAEKAANDRREGREREHRGQREQRSGGQPPRDRRPMRQAPGEPQRPASPQGRPEERRDFQPRERTPHFRDRRDRGPVERENRPYLSPFFDVVFYPEDEVFQKIVQRVRDSRHTFELFEIARAVLAKSERCVIVVRRKPDATGNQAPVHVSVVDNLPFENEEAAINHVTRNLMDHFFTIEEVELEPPKGSFAVVSRCGTTGELLAPPNYHRYQSILQQHHAARLPNMPFEQFRDRLENVREPEVIQAWLEKMKKGVRYTWKTPAEGAAPVSFEAPEDARNHLLSNNRDQVVQQLEHARFHGKLLEKLPDTEIRRAVEGHIERQRRFPLETANALRGRLRREGFTIFKKGAKGVSYVCAVKRKFRVPGQTFSDSINNIIHFIETHPMVSIRELPAQLTGVFPPPPAPAGESQAVRADVTPEEDTLVRRLLADLRWLVSEGYVTEYSNGKLYAPPAVAPHSRKDDEDDADEAHASDPAPDHGETGGRDAAGAAPAVDKTQETAGPAGPAETPHVDAPADEPVSNEPVSDEPTSGEPVAPAEPVVQEPPVASSGEDAAPPAPEPGTAEPADGEPKPGA